MTDIKIGRFGDPPDFVNEQGVKWWMVATNIFMVELPTGEQEYVGIRNGEIVANGTALDAVALRLELLGHVDPPQKETPRD